MGLYDEMFDFLTVRLASTMQFWRTINHIWGSIDAWTYTLRFECFGAGLHCKSYPGCLETFTWKIKSRLYYLQVESPMDHFTKTAVHRAFMWRLHGWCGFFETLVFRKSFQEKKPTAFYTLWKRNKVVHISISSSLPKHSQNSFDTFEHYLFHKFWCQTQTSFLTLTKDNIRHTLVFLLVRGES